MHVLHAIHDFLPRHQAGSELYVMALAREQSARHHVTVLCADYDPSRDHGHVSWRVHDGIPVVEIVNNWRCASFEDTYRPPVIGDRIRHALQTLRPDVVHIHNLMNLSFDLPAMARSLGIPVVATLHDYTLICPSGGQRVHKKDNHVCVEIDATRCARCFKESPFYQQAAIGATMNGTAPKFVMRAASTVRALMPRLTASAAGMVARTNGLAVSPADIEARLASAREIFRDVDLFVSPSASLAQEYTRFGLSRERIRVSDYGMRDAVAPARRDTSRPIRIGMIGTLVWHKGAHIFIDALRQLPRDAYEARVFGSLTTFPEYVAEIRKSAAGLPIEFRGAFPTPDAMNAYAEIDVLVVPSLWQENSPLVIHEAFQAGVPVVGSRIGGIPDLVTDGVSGLLFDAGSAPDLAAKLNTLIDAPERIASLAAALPAVKSMSADASEWDQTYAQLRQ